MSDSDLLKLLQFLIVGVAVVAFGLMALVRYIRRKSRPKL